MLRECGVFFGSAFAVGQDAETCRATVAIDRTHDSEPRQHALRSTEPRKIALRQADADTLGLVALHTAVSIEKATQETCMEGTRASFYRGCDGFVARCQAMRMRELLERRSRKTEFAAILDCHPAGE